MVHENEIVKFTPEGSNLTFHLKPQGWFEKMTLADHGWTMREYLELTIMKVEEKQAKGDPIIYNKMTSDIWRKLTTEQGVDLKDKCFEINQKYAVNQDFPGTSPKEVKEKETSQ